MVFENERVETNEDLIIKLTGDQAAVDALDFETDEEPHTCELNITAFGSIGGRFVQGFEHITITLTDLDEPPFFADVPPDPVEYDENEPFGFVLGQLNATDVDVLSTGSHCGVKACTYSIVCETLPGFVAINSTDGTLSVDSPIDYEEHTNFSCVVRAENSLAVETTVNFVIRNLQDERPVLGSLPSVSVGENVQNILLVDIDAEDPDQSRLAPPASPDCNGECEYEIVPGSVDPPQYASQIVINTETGELTLSSASLNFELDNNITLTVNVTDIAGLWASGPLTIVVLDEPDPTFVRPLHRMGLLTSSSTNDTNMPGASFLAEDEDVNQSVTWEVVSVVPSLSGQGDPSTFRIAPPPRVFPAFTDTSAAKDEDDMTLLFFRVDNTTDPDPGVYDITVRARDANASLANDASLWGTATSKLLISDSNDKHSVSDFFANVSEFEVAGHTLGSVKVADVDPAQSFEFTVLSPWSEMFELKHECEPLVLPASRSLANSAHVPERCPGGQVSRSAVLNLKSSTLQASWVLDTFGSYRLSIPISVQDDGVVLTAKNGFTEYGFPSGTPSVHIVRANLHVTVIPDPSPVQVLNVVAESKETGFSTEGGEFVYLHGTSLQPSPPYIPGNGTRTVPESRLVFVNATSGEEFVGDPCIVVASRTSLRCFSPEGHGLNVSGKLTMGGTSVDLPGFFRYAPPVVFTVEGPGAEAASPAGGDQVIITGINFGRPQSQHEVKFGRGFSRIRSEAGTFLAEMCNMTIPHRQLACNLPQGTGQDLSWNVRAFDQVAEVPTSSYLPPNITSVTVLRGALELVNSTRVAVVKRTNGTADVLPSMPTTGSGGLLLINGTGLGSSLEEVDFVQLGPEQSSGQLSDDASRLICIMENTAGNSSLLCQAAEGFGSGFKVQLRARGGLSEIFPIPLSYAAPEANRVSVPSGEGGQLLETKAQRMFVTGENFGPLAAPKQIQLTTVPAPGQFTVPTTELPVNGPHSQVEVPRMPGGNGVGHSLVFSVDGREAPPLLVDYRPPSLSKTISLVNGSVVAPPIVLNLVGANFARCCWLQKNANATLEEKSDCRCTHHGEDAIVVTLDTQSSANTPCIVISVDDEPEESLTCKLYPPSAELLVRQGNISVTVGGQTALMPFLYEDLLGRLVLNRIEPAQKKGLSTKDGGEVILRGSNFGKSFGIVQIFDGNTIVASTVDAQWKDIPCGDDQGCNWDETEVRVPLPPGQGGFNMRLTLPGAPNKTSESVIANYSTPVIMRTNANELQITTEGAWSTTDSKVRSSGNASLLVITGTNFGTNETMSSTIAELLQAQNQDGGRIATPACASSSDASSGKGVPEDCKIRDKSMQLQNKVLVGGRQCAIVSWEHTQIRCLVPDGAGTVDIQVFVYKRRVASTSGLVLFGGLNQFFEIAAKERSFSYAAPQIDTIVYKGALRPYTVPNHYHSRTAGGDLIEISGKSFGTPDLLQAIGKELVYTLNGNTIGSTKNHSHNSIIFTSPPGTGFDLPLVVEVGELKSAPALFSYDPMVIAVMHAVGQTSGFVRLSSLVGETSFASAPSFAPRRRLLEADALDEIAVAVPQDPNSVHSNINPSNATQLIPGTPGFASRLALDAAGSTIALRGWNFGPRAPGVATVSVGGLPCAAGTGYTNAWQGDSLLRCVLPSSTVGQKEVVVQVGSQSFTIPKARSPVLQTCDQGFFGVVPDVDSCQPCLECGTADCLGQSAALCPGGAALPEPAAGFWQLDLSQPLARQWSHLTDRQRTFLSTVNASNAQQNLAGGSGLTLEDVALAGVVPSSSRWVMVPCDPPQACFGNNTCQPGFAGTACQLCADTFYRSRDSRRIGQCDSCSAANPGVVLFATAALAAGPLSLLAYFLIKLAPSTVGITLSLQLIQIIAILVKLPMPWGTLARLLSNAGLASMLALAIIPPECSFLKWNFLQSWFAYQSIPVMVTAAAVLTGFSHWVFLLVHRACVQKRKGESCCILVPWQHAARTWYLLMDLFYVGMVASALEVFSCKEVGGKQVLSADVEIDCFGEDYDALFISASVAVALYAVGFPLLVTVFLGIFRDSAVRNLDVIETERDPDAVLPRAMVTLLMAAAGTSSSQQGKATDNITAAERTHIRVHAFLGKLYSPHSSDAVMWPGTMLVFRGLVVVTVAFLLDEPVLASLSVAVTLGSLSTVLALVRPFRAVQLVSSFPQAAKQGALGMELMRAQQRFANGIAVHQQPLQAPGQPGRLQVEPADSDPDGTGGASSSAPTHGMQPLLEGHEHLSFAEDPQQEEVEVYAPMRRFSVDALARPAKAPTRGARARARSGSDDGDAVSASIRMLSLDASQPAVAAASTKKRRRSSVAMLTGRASGVGQSARSSAVRSSAALGGLSGIQAASFALEEDETWPAVTMVWLGLTPEVAIQLERDFKQHWAITRSCGRRVKFKDPNMPKLRPINWCCRKTDSAAQAGTVTQPERWGRSLCSLMYAASRLCVRHVLMLALQYNHLGAMMCALLFIAVQGSLLRELTSTTIPIEEIAVSLMFAAMLWTCTVELVLAAAYWRWQMAARAVYLEGKAATSSEPRQSCCSREGSCSECWDGCHQRCSRVTNAVAGAVPRRGMPGSLQTQRSAVAHSNPLRRSQQGGH